MHHEFPRPTGQSLRNVPAAVIKKVFLRSTMPEIQAILAFCNAEERLYILRALDWSQAHLAQLAAFEG